MQYKKTSISVKNHPNRQMGFLGSGNDYERMFNVCAVSFPVRSIS
jgi:hypothetical protein